MESLIEKRVANISSMLEDLCASVTGGVHADSRGGHVGSTITGIATADVATLLHNLEEALGQIKGDVHWMRVASVLLDSEAGIFTFITEVLRKKVAAMTSFRQDAVNQSVGDGGLKGAAELLNTLLTLSGRQHMQVPQLIYIASECTDLLRRTLTLKGVSGLQEALFPPLQQALLAAEALNVPVSSLNIPQILQVLLKYAAVSGGKANPRSQKARKNALFFIGFASQRFAAEVSKSPELCASILKCFKDNVDSLMSSETPELSVAAGLLEGLGKFLSSLPEDGRESAFIGKVYHVLCRGLDLHDHTRYEVPKASMYLLEKHCFLFRQHLKGDERMLPRMVTLVSHRNSDVTKQALAAAGAYAATISVVLSEPPPASASPDEAAAVTKSSSDFFRTAFETSRSLLRRTDSHSVSLGAVLLGHLLRPSVYFEGLQAERGSDSAAKNETSRYILDTLLSKFFELYAESDVLQATRVNHPGGEGDVTVFQDSIEVLARYLPSFIDSLAACVLAMPGHLMTSVVEQQLTDALRTVYTHYGKSYVFPSTRLKIANSLLHLLLALYAKGEVLSRILSGLMLGALLQTLGTGVVTTAPGPSSSAAATTASAVPSSFSLSLPAVTPGSATALRSQAPGGGGGQGGALPSGDVDLDDYKNNAFDVAYEVRSSPYLTLWGVLIRTASPSSSEQGGRAHLEGTWGALLSGISEAGHSHFCSVVFDSLMGSLLEIMNALDLSYAELDESGPAVETHTVGPTTATPARTPGQPGAEETPETEAAAAPPPGGIRPANPADFALFKSLAVFFCGVLAKVSHSPPSSSASGERRGTPAIVAGWHLPISVALLGLRSRRPLIPELYEMMASLLRKIDWGETASRGNEGTELRSTILSFVGETMGAVHEASGGLLISQLELLLSLGPGMLQMVASADTAPGALRRPDGQSTTARLMGCVQLALHTGLSFPPAAELAVSSLETWLSVDLTEAQHLLLCEKMVPVLEAFISASSSIIGSDASAAGSAAGSGSAARKGPHRLTGAGVKSTRGAGRSSQGAQLAKSERDRLEEVQMRCLVVLGSLGSAPVAKVLLGSSGAEEEKGGGGGGSGVSGGGAAPWDTERRVVLRLALADSKYNLAFDSLLPRVCEMALTHTERKVKIAACELLHSIIVWTIGRNAIQPSRGGDAAGKPPPANFTRLNKRLYPVALTLAVDAEPIAQQLFGKLLFQIIHWCTRNVHFESPDTMVLLDALIDGVSQASEGHRRDLAASACAEFVKYSIKYGSKTGDRNIVSVFTRVNSLAAHPDPAKRLGAAKALYKIAAEVFPHPRYFSALMLPITQAGVTCLSMTEHRPSSVDATPGSDAPGLTVLQEGAVSTPACVALLKRCERLIVAKSQLLTEKGKSKGAGAAASGVNLAALIAAGLGGGAGGAPSEGEGSPAAAAACNSLEAFISWLVEQCFFEEKLTRQWSMRLFVTFTTCLPGCGSDRGPSIWMQKVYSRDRSLVSIFRAIDARLTALPARAGDIPRTMQTLRGSRGAESRLHTTWSTELETICDAYAWALGHSLADLTGLLPKDADAEEHAISQSQQQQQPRQKKRRAAASPEREGGVVASPAASLATLPGGSAVPRHIYFYVHNVLSLVAALAEAQPGAAVAEGVAGPGVLAGQLRDSHRCVESIAHAVLALLANGLAGGLWDRLHTEEECVGGGFVVSKNLTKLAATMLLRPARLGYDPNSAHAQTAIPSLGKKLLRRIASGAKSHAATAGITAAISEVLAGDYHPTPSAAEGAALRTDPMPCAGENNLFKLGAVQQMLRASGSGSAAEGEGGEGAEGDDPAAPAGYTGSRADVIHLSRGCRALQELGILQGAVSALEPDLTSPGQTASSLFSELVHLPLDLTVRPGSAVLLREICQLAFDLGLGSSEVLTPLCDTTPLSAADLAVGRVSKSFSTFFLGGGVAAELPGGGSSAAPSATPRASRSRIGSGGGVAIEAGGAGVAKCHAFYTAFRVPLCDYLLAKPPPEGFFTRLHSQNTRMFYRVASDLADLCAVVGQSAGGGATATPTTPRAQIAAAFLEAAGKPSILPLVIRAAMPGAGSPSAPAATPTAAAGEPDADALFLSAERPSGGATSSSVTPAPAPAPAALSPQERTGYAVSIVASFLRVSGALLPHRGGGGGDAEAETSSLIPGFAVWVVGPAGGEAQRQHLLKRPAEDLKNVCRALCHICPAVLMQEEEEVGALPPAAGASSETAPLLRAIEALVTQELPVHYTEVFRDEPGGASAGSASRVMAGLTASYIKVVDSLLGCLAASGSVALLEKLFTLFRGAGPHPLADKFSAHLMRYFGGMPQGVPSIQRCAAKCIEVFANDSIPGDIRCAAVSRVCSLALLRLPPEGAESFFAEHCVGLFKHLSADWPSPHSPGDCISALITKTSVLSLFELMYRLCSADSTKTSINEKFASALAMQPGMTQFQGKEMNGKIVRTAYDAVTQRLFFEDAVSRASYSNVKGGDALLRYRQAAYNCLASALIATQNNTTMIARLLFIPRAGDEILERVVDLDKAHFFSVETSFPVQHQAMHAIRHDWNSGPTARSNPAAATAATPASASLTQAYGTAGVPFVPQGPHTHTPLGSAMQSPAGQAGFATPGPALPAALTQSEFVRPQRRRGAAVPQAAPTGWKAALQQHGTPQGGDTSGAHAAGDAEDVEGEDSPFNAHSVVPLSGKAHREALLSQVPPAPGPAVVAEKEKEKEKETPRGEQGGGGGARNHGQMTWSLFSQNAAPPLTPCIDFKLKENLLGEAGGLGGGGDPNASPDDLLEKPEAWEAACLARYAEGDLEMDELNRIPVMAAALRGILFLVCREREAQGGGSGGASDEPPLWMAELLRKAGSPSTHINIRVFIAKVVVNFADIFQKYAHHWVTPLIDIAMAHHAKTLSALDSSSAANRSPQKSSALSVGHPGSFGTPPEGYTKKDTFGVTYFVRDIVLTLIAWRTTADNKEQVRLKAAGGDMASPERGVGVAGGASAASGNGIPGCGVEAEGRVSQLLEFLLKNCTHSRRRVLRENIELIKILIEQWGGRVRIGPEHKRIVMGWVCYSEGADPAASVTASSPWVQARITGMQLLGTLITNGIPAYDPFNDATLMTERDFYAKLLANAPPHPHNRTLPKEIVDVASELIGMILHQQFLKAAPLLGSPAHPRPREGSPGSTGSPRSSLQGAGSDVGGQQSAQHLYDRVRSKLRSLHDRSQIEQFLLLLGGVVKHYPAMADEFMPHRLLKLVPLSKGVYTLLILEIIRRRAEHFPSVYTEFHPFVHDLLLATGTEAVDIRLNTLEILKIALLSDSTGQAGAGVGSTSDVNHFVMHVSRGIRSRLFVAGVLDVDSKAAVYDLWIRVYDAHTHGSTAPEKAAGHQQHHPGSTAAASPLSDEAREKLTQYLLYGLHDQNTYIKDKILRFWDDPSRLQASAIHRAEKLFVFTEGASGEGGKGGSLCSPALGDRWLQYSSILLLFLAHRSPDFRDRYTFFKDPLAECDYNEMRIVSAPGSRTTLRGYSAAYGDTAASQASLMPMGTPGFVGTQAPLSLFGGGSGFRGEDHILATIGYVSGAGGLGATQGTQGGFGTQGLQTASNFAHYEPRTAQPTALSQTAMLFQPFDANDMAPSGGRSGTAHPPTGSSTVTHILGRPGAASASAGRHGVFFVKNKSLKKRFQRTTTEQSRSVAALYASRAAAARQDSEARAKLEEGSEVRVWRLYRDGEVPDIQISPSSLLLPLEALCLYDVETAKLVLSELASQIYTGLAATSHAPPSASATAPGSESNPLTDFPDVPHQNPGDLDTTMDGTGALVGRFLEGGGGGGSGGAADPSNPAAAAAQRRTLRQRLVESFATLSALMPQHGGVVSFLNSFLLSESNRERFHSRDAAVAAAAAAKGGGGGVAALAAQPQFVGRCLMRLDPAVVLNTSLVSGNVSTGLLMVEAGITYREERIASLESEIWNTRQQRPAQGSSSGGAASSGSASSSSAAQGQGQGQGGSSSSSSGAGDLFPSEDGQPRKRARGGEQPNQALADAAASAAASAVAGRGRAEKAVHSKEEEVGMLKRLNSAAYDGLVELYRHLGNGDAANGVMTDRVLEGEALRGARCLLGNDFDRALTIFTAELERDHPKKRLLEQSARRCMSSLMKWPDLSQMCDLRCPLDGDDAFSPHNREALAQQVASKTHISAAALPTASGNLPDSLHAILRFVEERVEPSLENMQSLLSLNQFLNVSLAFLMSGDVQSARQYSDMGLAGILKGWGATHASHRTARDTLSMVAVLQPLVELSQCLKLATLSQQQNQGMAGAELLPAAEKLMAQWARRARHFGGTPEQWAGFTTARGVMTDLLHSHFAAAAAERLAESAGVAPATAPEGLRYPLLSRPGICEQRLSLLLGAADAMDAGGLPAPSRVFLHQYSTLRKEVEAHAADFATEMAGAAPGGGFSAMDVRFTFLAARNALSRAGSHSTTPEKAKKLFLKAEQYAQQEDQRLGLSSSDPVAFHSLVGDAHQGVYAAEHALGDFPAASQSAGKAMSGFKHAVAKAQGNSQKASSFEKLGLFADTLLKSIEARRQQGGASAQQGGAQPQEDVDALVQTLIKSILGAVITGASYASRMRIPRLLEVLENHPGHKETFLKNVKNVDSWLLLPWVNQVVSYIGGSAGDVVVALLQKMSRKFPQQVFYALSASSAELDAASYKNTNGCRETIRRLQEHVRATLAGESHGVQGGVVPHGGLLVEAFVRSLEQLHNPDLRFKYYMEELASGLKELKASPSSAGEIQSRVSLLWSQMYADLFDTKLRQTMGETNLNLKFMVKSREQFAVKSASGGPDVSLYSDIERTLKPIVRDVAILLNPEKQRGGSQPPLTFEHLQLRMREWQNCIKSSWGYAKTVGTVPLATYSDFLAGYNANKTMSLSETAGQAGQTGASAPAGHTPSLAGDYILLPHQPFRYLHTTSPAEMPDVVSMSQNVLVLGSIQKPKRLVVRCSDETERSFLVKGGEDLRQDQRIEQLFYMFNSCIGSADRASGLSIDGYGVIPLSPKVGLVEWVDDCAPLKALIEARLPKTIPHLQHHPAARKYHEFVTSLSAVSSSDWLGGFRVLYGDHGKTDLTAKYAELQGAVQPNLLKASLYAMCATHSAFYSQREQFAKSYAAASVGQWVLGIGDRHLDNFLVDKARCRAVPIDFGHAFGSATEILHVPELMPFRLTPQLTTVFEPLGATFLKGGMVKTLNALHSSRDLLLDVLSVFVREPLSTWRRTALRKGKKVLDQAAAGGAAVPQGTAVERQQQAYADAKLDAVKQKLSLVNPYVPATADLAGNTAALSACLRHKEGFANASAILKGRPGVNIRASVPATCRSTAEQVDCLVDMATDPNILCRTYMGWSPLF